MKVMKNKKYIGKFSYNKYDLKYVLAERSTSFNKLHISYKYIVAF